MAGYSGRNRPSEGVYEELYAKALALEDFSGRRVVLVTTDLVGITAPVAKNIADRAERQFSLPRDRLILSSSHTHCGPVVASDYLFYDMPAAQIPRIEQYTHTLEDKIVAVIGEAINQLAPARLSFGRTQAGFAMNRRENPRQGAVDLEKAKGPVDREVPFLRIDTKHGELRGVVFGYACHNTTLGPDFCQFHGDYAGDAQKWLEERHPGAQALFVQDCGADADPYPRGGVDVAHRHGEELAVAVDKTLGARTQAVSGPLKTAWDDFPLRFAPPPTREDLQKKLSSDDFYVRKHAQAMLDILDRDGHLPAAYPYPIEVWQFGRDLTFVALAGEVVVDYDLRLKRELGPRNLWVAGYCNDVSAYIPSLRILREGGYEGGGAMIYYGRPGPFAPSVEETIVTKVHGLVDRTAE
jgi:neutral ceramidase